MIYLWYLVSPLWAMLIIVIWDQLELLRSSGVPTKYSTSSLYPIHAALFQVPDRLSRKPWYGENLEVLLKSYNPAVSWNVTCQDRIAPLSVTVITPIKGRRRNRHKYMHKSKNNSTWNCMWAKNHLASMFKLSNNWSGLSQLINEYNWRHVVAISHSISMQMTQVQLHLSLGFKISRSLKT